MSETNTRRHGFREALLKKLPKLEYKGGGMQGQLDVSEDLGPVLELDVDDFLLPLAGVIEEQTR